MKKLVCLIVAFTILLTLCSCDSPQPEPLSSPSATPEESQQPEAETEAETAEEAPEDELVLKEREIVSRLDYSDRNFICEKDFYEALEDMLEIQGLSMTACGDGTAYFTFDYTNVTSVKLLTMSKTRTQVEEDTALAREALDDPDDDLTPNELEFAEALFDAQKDVFASDDLVTSFVVSCSESQDDQTLMFIVASAAMAILNPNYSDTKQAFSDLKNNLFGLYNNSGGNAVSWIDGVNFEESFTVPGNAIESWLGALDDGNYYMTITPYIKYDEMIDIAGSGGSSLTAQP